MSTATLTKKSIKKTKKKATPKVAAAVKKSAATENLLKKIYALPLESQSLIMKEIKKNIDFAKKKTKKKSTKKYPRKSTNPDNPSPSGDTWWDNPENVRIVKEGMAELKAGRVVRAEDSPILQKFFTEYRKK
jgi:hypothetical protein